MISLVYKKKKQVKVYFAAYLHFYTICTLFLTFSAFASVYYNLNFRQARNPFPSNLLVLYIIILFVRYFKKFEVSISIIFLVRLSSLGKGKTQNKHCCIKAKLLFILNLNKVLYLPKNVQDMGKERKLF